MHYSLYRPFHFYYLPSSEIRYQFGIEYYHAPSFYYRFRRAAYSQSDAFLVHRLEFFASKHFLTSPAEALAKAGLNKFMHNRYAHFHFTGQKQGETILLLLHRHWFDILKQMLVVFFMIIALLASLITLPSYFPIITEIPNYNRIFFFFESTFAMLIWMVFFIIWIDYYLDVWIITNSRVVNIEQKGLFSRQISELELENIQDITTEVKGMIPTFLNYGQVFIQTAAEKERFIFRNIPDPYHTKDVLMALQERQEKKEAGEIGEAIRKKMNPLE